MVVPSCSHEREALNVVAGVLRLYVLSHQRRRHLLAPVDAAA
jgi:hypothetical protein